MSLAELRGLVRHGCHVTWHMTSVGLHRTLIGVCSTLKENCTNIRKLKQCQIKYQTMVAINPKPKEYGQRSSQRRRRRDGVGGTGYENSNNPHLQNEAKSKLFL